MLTLLVVLVIIVAILLILIVLAQDPKSGGLINQAGATQLMGVKRTGDLLEKITWGLAVAIMVISISTAFVIKSDDEDYEDGIPTTTAIEQAEKAKGAVQQTQAPMGSDTIGTTQDVAPAPAEETPKAPTE